MKLTFIIRKITAYGGLGIFLRNIVNYIKKEDLSISVISSSSVIEELEFHKIKEYKLGSFLSLFLFNFSVSKLLRKIKTDCVTSFERTPGCGIYRAGEGVHKRWLDIRKKDASFFKKISFKLNPLHFYTLYLEKKIFNEAKIIIVNSKMVKKEIIDYYGVKENKIKVIYNGINLKKFNIEQKQKHKEAVREKYKIKKDEKIIFFAGSGFQRKGLLSLIKAISLLTNEEIKVLIAGKGKTLKYKKLARKYGVPEKILFLGVCGKINELYPAADLFLLPTLYDPFSGAVLEAMASGVCVITTANNGACEAVKDGYNGYVVRDPLNGKEIAEKIKLCLKRSDELGKNAYASALDFNIEKTAGEYLNLIKGFCYEKK